MLSNLRVISACIRQQFLTSIGRNTFKFCVLVQPIIYGFILGMMYQNKSSHDFMVYVLFGSGIVSFWSSICFSSASDIQRERWMGTLETIFVAPSGFKNILLGKVIGNTFWGLISMVISSLFVIIVFKKPLLIASPALLIVGFIMMTLSFIAIALSMAGLFTLSRNSRVLMNCLEHPVYLLCGIVFPLEIIPMYIRPISYLLSPTWAVKVLRAAVVGGQNSQALYYLLGLTFLTIIYFIISYILFEKIDYKARVEASLGVY